MFHQTNAEKKHEVFCNGLNSTFSNSQIHLHFKLTDTLQDILGEISESTSVEVDELTLVYSGRPVTEETIGRVLENVIRYSDVLNFLVKNPKQENTITGSKDSSGSPCSIM